MHKYNSELNNKSLLIKIESFLNKEECTDLITKYNYLNYNKKSKIDMPNYNDGLFLTYESYEYEPDLKSLINKKITDIITTYDDINEPTFISLKKYGEISYKSGIGIKKHFDEKKWTLLIYLNTVGLGGETVFPNFDTKDIIIKPVEGTLLLFCNHNEDSKIDKALLHYANPIINKDDEKYIAQIQFGKKYIN